MGTEESGKVLAPVPTSHLANASFSLGFGSLILLLLCLLFCDFFSDGTVLLLIGGFGMLAAMLGAVALIRIKMVKKLLRGRDRAIAGIFFGLVFIPAGLLLPAVVPSRGGCGSYIRKTTGEVMALSAAVDGYLDVYSQYPGQNAWNADHHYSGAEYGLLVATLRGSNLVWNGKPSNPRSIFFLSVDERHIVTTKVTGTAQAGELADPWGNRYEVVADWTGDNQIDTPLADGEGVQHRGVAVWSYGPKAKPDANPKDNTHIRSWR